MARWLLLGLGAATFLVVAKSHGRQIRLERELAGYWEVTFGAQNPAWVESLWRRDRFVYWGVAASIALLTIGIRVLAARFAWHLPLVDWADRLSWVGALYLHLILPLTGAFVAAGLLSLIRFVVAARAENGPTNLRPAEWLADAVRGSAAWWALTLVMGTALLILASRRRQ
jgi:hypothetical protein